MVLSRFSRCPQGSLLGSEGRRIGSAVPICAECEFVLDRDSAFADIVHQAYGEEGVVKAIEILEHEIVRAMRLLGVSNVSQLRPEMVSLLKWSSLVCFWSNSRSCAQVEHVNWQPITSRL